MAIVEVKVPQLSESIAEATMLNWKKKPGEAVAVGGEGADGSHCAVPLLYRAAPFAASMAVDRTGDDRTAPLGP